MVSIQSGEGGIDVGTWEENNVLETGGTVEVNVERGGETPETSRPAEPSRLGLGHPSTMRRPGLGPSQLRQDLSAGHPSRSVSATSGLPHMGPMMAVESVTHPTSGHSRPLSQVSAIGTGFQIGLSPVSPGFVIMPERRHGGTERVGRRRTVSEGDLTRQIREVEMDEGWGWWLGKIGRSRLQ